MNIFQRNIEKIHKVMNQISRNCNMLVHGNFTLGYRKQMHELYIEILDILSDYCEDLEEMEQRAMEESER